MVLESELISWGRLAWLLDSCLSNLNISVIWCNYFCLND